MKDLRMKKMKILNDPKLPVFPEATSVVGIRCPKKRQIIECFFTDYRFWFVHNNIRIASIFGYF